MAWEINGQTRLVGVVGWPIAHSLSPVMHNAAFEALGLNWCYVPLPVAPEHTDAVVRGLITLSFAGANVTVPHKSAVLDKLDEIEPKAKSLGAVNTLVVKRDDGDLSIFGYNTDVPGIIGTLQRGSFAMRTDQRAVVVGAGGAARAVVFALQEAGLRNIMVLNRTLAHARALVEDLQLDQECALSLTSEALVESAREADLLINATTVGMWPHINASIWPKTAPIPTHLTVFDLVYNPLETCLLRQARQAGACALDGLEMLVLQGALAFELWTGEPAPFEIMRQACEHKLLT